MQKSLLPLSLALIAVVLLVALNAAQRRTTNAELALSETTLAAASQAADDLAELTLSLDKLRLAASDRQSAALLSQIALCADRVQQSLAHLPDTQGQLEAILAYLSQVRVLAQEALIALAESPDAPQDSRISLIGMTDGLRLLLSEMSLAQQDLLLGEKAASLPATELTAPPSAQELAEYRALPSREISAGEAMQIAREFVGPERAISVSPAPDTAGAMPAYGISVQTADVLLNLEITRRGGKVLLMAPETAGFSMRKSPEECATAALDFLHSRGFAQSEALYYQIYDGLCVLTCTHVQQGVLIWPDKVLVQVRMDTGEVVGLEARSYWQNHIPRKLQKPLLTKTEARAYLAEEATVDSARLCLLPSDGQERLCWQFTLSLEEDRYISYIDAINGGELLLEKILHLEYGEVPA